MKRLDLTSQPDPTSSSVLTMMVSEDKGNLSTQVEPGRRYSTRLIPFRASDSRVTTFESWEGGINSGRGRGGGPRGWSSLRMSLISGLNAENAFRAVLPILID